CVGLLEFVSAEVRIQPARIFFVEFVGSVPIDKTRGKVFPVVALSAVVMDTIALDFPLRGELVRTIFQDQSLGMLLWAQTRRQDQRKGDHEDGNEELAHTRKDEVEGYKDVNPNLPQVFLRSRVETQHAASLSRVKTGNPSTVFPRFPKAQCLDPLKAL